MNNPLNDWRRSQKVNIVIAMYKYNWYHKHDQSNREFTDLNHVIRLWATTHGY